MARMRGVGQGAAVPCPASARSHPGARAALRFETEVIATAEFIALTSLAHVSCSLYTIGRFMMITGPRAAIFSYGS